MQVRQNRSDWAAAEQALRNVLGIEPNDEEARSNLAVLLRQRGEATMSAAAQRALGLAAP